MTVSRHALANDLTENNMPLNKSQIHNINHDVGVSMLNQFPTPHPIET